MPREAMKEHDNKERKKYKPGDHIHVVVTQDFARTATEFYAFCRQYHFNPAGVIRGHIQGWLKRQEELHQEFGHMERDKDLVLGEIVRKYPWLRQVLQGAM